MPALNTGTLTYLERLIDHAGLKAVVEALAEACQLKAEHIHANWQDSALAAAWALDGEDLAETARRLAH